MTIKITYIYKSQRFKPLHQAYISPGRYIMCLLLQEVHQSHFHTMCACFRPIFSHTGNSGVQRGGSKIFDTGKIKGFYFWYLPGQSN